MFLRLLTTLSTILELTLSPSRRLETLPAFVPAVDPEALSKSPHKSSYTPQALIYCELSVSGTLPLQPVVHSVALVQIQTARLGL